MRNVRDQEQAAETAEAFTRPRTRTAEIARTAAAIEKLQHTAIAAAEHETSMRNGIGQVFVSLSRRNQSLLQKQLRLIDALEQKAADPGALADLFLLDHLTTRMRRHAENLIILSGEPPGRSWSEPVPVIDVLRGAVAEIEDYQRIRVVTVAQDAVTGLAVADMIHLLAELIENAALFSPSGTRVEVRAERVANGFVVEVEDRGLGIQPHLLSDINQQLLDPADFALADPDRLGLFVVGKLAARHGVRVALKPSPYGGITAVALMPHEVVVPATAPEIGGAHDADHGTGGLTGLNRGAGDALVLTGRHAASPAAPETGDADDEPAAAPGSPPSSPSPFSLGMPDSFPSPLDPAPAGSSPAPLSPVPADDFRSPFAPAPSGNFRNPLSPVPADSAPSPFNLPSPVGSRGPFDPAPADGTRGPFDPAPQDGSRSPFSLDTAPAKRAEPAGTYRGLPRRVRQASLSQHLKNNPASGAPASPADPEPERSGERTPETARDFVASFRTGWRRDEGTRAAEPPAEPAGRPDSAAPHGEDT
jgi:hypothetical protein